MGKKRRLFAPGELQRMYDRGVTEERAAEAAGIDIHVTAGRPTGKRIGDPLPRRSRATKRRRAR